MDVKLEKGGVSLLECKLVCVRVVRIKTTVVVMWFIKLDDNFSLATAMSITQKLYIDKITYE